MVSVLLIGSGSMGKTHLREYVRMKAVKVVGIVDIERSQIPGIDIDYFSSFEEAIHQLGKVDIVDICLPTYLHREFVEKAASSGIDIICEKPIAGTLEDAEAIIQTCEHHGVRLFIGQVVRFFPEYEQAKRLLEEGAIGKPAMMRTSRNSPFPHGWNDWYSQQDLSGGLLLDLLIHDFDFLRSCFGEVERVFTKSVSNRGMEKQDYALVTLRFQNGVIAHVEGSWSHERFHTKFELAGDEGILEFNSLEAMPIDLGISQTSHTGVAVPKSPVAKSPYYRELEHFIDCVTNKSAPIVTADDAYKALEIAVAAKKSLLTNKPVQLGMKRGVSI